MHIAKCEIKGISPYSQARFTEHQHPKLNKEQHADYDERIWRKKAHYNANGQLIIPQMAFKTCLQSTAQYLGMQIQGKGKSTYSKHFTAGVLVIDAPVVMDAKGNPITENDVDKDTIHCAANGLKGSAAKGKVWRNFPVIQAGWQTSVVFHILDDIITNEVFEYHLKQAGQFRGIGRFRPESGGYYGRFAVEAIDWQRVS